MSTRQIIKRFPATRIEILTEYNDEPTCVKALEAGTCKFKGKDDLLPLWTRISGFQIKF